MERKRRETKHFEVTDASMGTRTTRRNSKQNDKIKTKRDRVGKIELASQTSG